MWSGRFIRPHNFVLETGTLLSEVTWWVLQCGLFVCCCACAGLLFGILGIWRENKGLSWNLDCTGRVYSFLMNKRNIVIFAQEVTFLR
jgi:hypothetical protein